MNKSTLILCSALLSSGASLIVSAQTAPGADGKQIPAVAEVRVKSLGEVMSDTQKAINSKDAVKAEAATKVLLERKDLNAVQRYNALMNLANLYRSSNKIQLAEKNYLLAAAVSGIEPKQAENALNSKNNMYFDSFRAVIRANNIDATVKAYKELIAVKDLSPVMRFNAAMDMRGAYDRAKKPAESFATLQEASHIEGLPPKELLRAVTQIGEKHFRDNFPGSGNGAYLTDGLNKAIATYEEALKNPVFGNMEKIELYRRIADCRLEFMDVAGALSELDKAYKLNAMTPEEKFTASYNKGSVLLRALEYRNALSVFREAEKESKSFKENDRRLKDLDSRINACIYNIETPAERKARIESVIKSETKSANDKVSVLRDSGELDAAAAIYASIIDDKSRNQNDRFGAFREIINMYMNAGRFADAKKYGEKYGDAFIQEDPKRNGNLYRVLFLGSNLKHRNIHTSGAIYLWILNKHLAANKPDVQVMDAVVKCHIDAGDFASAVKSLDTALTIENLKPEQRLDYEMKKIVLGTEGKTGKIGSSLEKRITSNFEKVTEKEKSAKLLDAAKFAMSLRYFDVAKEIYSARAKLLVSQEKPSTQCLFVENAPRNISDFLASPYFKDEKNRAWLNRKYGTNLQFLLDTDAALTGRKVTEDTGGNEYTSFVALCDAEGVKFFFYMPCKDKKRLQEIRDGFSGMGGFETYLATGYYAPYYCFLIDCPPWNNLSVFNTQYNNTLHRNMSLKDKNLKIDFEILDDAVGCMMTLDWSVFVENLPVDGTEWDFEPIHWERGGWSWGGSESVHHRSSFGKLVFGNMTEANRTRIMRRLLVKARGIWNSANGSHGGLIEHWQDPELGDVEFNEAVVIPFKKKYSDYVGLIKADMTDADVNKVFTEAYPVLVNSYYVIQDMRRNWLDAKRVSDR